MGNPFVFPGQHVSDGARRLSSKKRFFHRSHLLGKKNQRPKEDKNRRTPSHLTQILPNPAYMNALPLLYGRREMPTKNKHFSVEVARCGLGGSRFLYRRGLVG